MSGSSIRTVGMAGLVLLGALVLLGFWLDSREAPPNPAELAAWTRAQDQDDEQAYRRFLEQWAGSRYADLARARMAEREQERQAREAADVERSRNLVLDVQRGLTRIGLDVAVTGSLDAATDRALREWMELAADAPLAIDRTMLDRLEQAWREREVLVWSQSELEGTDAAYAEYLRLYPDGRYAEAARAAIEALSLERDRRALILAMQAQLQRLGRPIEATGRIDGETAASLREFVKLTTGVDEFSLGPELLAELESRERWPLRPGDRFRDCPSCPELVVVPAGRFRMGSPVSEYGHQGNEAPVREVQLDRFALAVVETTFAQWDACVDAGGCRLRPDDADWGRDDRPVINVSLEDAQAYARWLSTVSEKRYRLPSEAEWEYAARAGSTSPFPTGECIDSSQANFDASRPFGDCPATVSLGRTAAVGMFPANAFGLHDMHGNVREWVSDCWNPSYRGAPVDGSAWMSGDCGRAVLRGGSWADTAIRVRSASRIRPSGAFHTTSTGFRVVRELRPGE